MIRREALGASPRVTAAVLTYDGRELLEVVLPSLARQRFRDFRALVVDNGSTDGTEEWMAAAWPDVEVIRLPTNVGVTPALNVCLTAPRTELVLLLNNDMELDPECLGELVRVLDEHPEAGSACPKLLSFHDREVLDGAGDLYLWSGEANRRGQGAGDVGQYDAPRAVFGACGGAALYRREALQTVGLFDERLFAIYEDVDWSFRAQLQGVGCRYVPSAVAYHMGSATLGAGLNDFTLYQNWRNGIWVLAKNYPLSALLRHGHSFIDAQAHHFVWAVQQRRVGVFARAWRDALRGMPAVMRTRSAVQRSRTVGLRELERVIGAEA
jgi:GT2 family glycosyltransferase